MLLKQRCLIKVNDQVKIRVSYHVASLLQFSLRRFGLFWCAIHLGRWTLHTIYELTWVWKGVLFEALAYKVYISERYCFSLACTFKRFIKVFELHVILKGGLRIWLTMNLPASSNSCLHLFVVIWWPISTQTGSTWIKPVLGTRNKQPFPTNKEPRTRCPLITLNLIFSVIYYLEFGNAITFYCATHCFYQQMSNWLFEHYRTLTFLLGK